MNFTLSIPQSDIKASREKVLKKLTLSTSIKGFRKGKAPTNLIEKKIGEKQIFEDILDQILPEAYAKHITKNKLKPLTMPKITPKDIKNKDQWEFDVEIAQKPTIKLGDYKKYTKEALSKLKKEKVNPKKNSQPDHDPKLVAIFDVLLEKTECEIPNLLLEKEIDNQLSKLVSQIQKLGLTLEKYLESMKTTIDDLKKQYKKSATDNLKLEFILQELIEKEKIIISDKEIDKLINSIGDENTKSRLKTPREREGIRYMLAKRKVVDKLTSR